MVQYWCSARTSPPALRTPRVGGAPPRALHRLAPAAAMAVGGEPAKEEEFELPFPDIKKMVEEGKDAPAAAPAPQPDNPLPDLPPNHPHEVQSLPTRGPAMKARSAHSKLCDCTACRSLRSRSQTLYRSPAPPPPKLSRRGRRISLGAPLRWSCPHPARRRSTPRGLCPSSLVEAGAWRWSSPSHNFLTAGRVREQESESEARVTGYIMPAPRLPTRLQQACLPLEQGPRGGPCMRASRPGLCAAAPPRPLQPPRGAVLPP